MKNDNDNSNKQYIYYLIADIEGLSSNINISFFNYYGFEYKSKVLKNSKIDNEIGRFFLDY